MNDAHGPEGHGHAYNNKEKLYIFETPNFSFKANLVTKYDSILKLPLACKNLCCITVHARLHEHSMSVSIGYDRLLPF